MIDGATELGKTLWKWLGDNSAPLAGLGGLTAVAVLIWQIGNGAPWRFLRSLPRKIAIPFIALLRFIGGRMPVRIVRNYRPLTPKQRALRLADEIERDVGKRDHMPREIRQRFRNTFRGYNEDAVEVYQEFFNTRGYGPGELYGLAFMVEWSHEDALALAKVLRGLDWGEG